MKLDAQQELGYAEEIERLAKSTGKDATWKLRAAGAISVAERLQVALIFKQATDCDKLLHLEALIGLQGAAAGLGVGSAAGAGAAAGPGPGSTAAAGAAAALGVGIAAVGEWTSTLKELRAVLPAMKLCAQLQLSQFVYTGSKASKSRQDKDFKGRLQTFYGNTLDEREHLRCMLVNVQLPMILVTGSHLFKYCWKSQLRSLLGLSDINDPRNGLLLFKPLEHAFDDSRICFSLVEEAGEPKFRLELLDMSLTGVKVWDYAGEQNLRKGYDETQIDSYAATVTFGELQGKALAFENAHRPYKRCLQFQAMQAVRRAKEENWLPADWAPSAGLSYNSEDAQELMDVWLAAAADAPPPDSEASSIPEE